MSDYFWYFFGSFCIIFGHFRPIFNPFFIFLPSFSTLLLTFFTAKVVAALPPDAQLDHVRRLSLPMLQYLHLAGQSTSSTNADLPTICTMLDRFSAVIKPQKTFTSASNAVHNAAMTVFMDAWPVLCRLLTLFSDQVDIVEHACRCIRAAVIAAGSLYTPLFSQTLDVLMQLFVAYGHYSCLYASRALVEAFGGIAESHNALFKFYQAIAQYVLQLNSPSDKMVEDFADLTIDHVKYYVAPVVPLLDGLFQFFIAGLTRFANVREVVIVVSDVFYDIIRT